jgi:hypothetical protein
MQLKPIIVKWPVILLLATLFWAGCKEKPQPVPPDSVPPSGQQGEIGSAPELRPPPPLSPVKPWSGQPTLKIYYDHEPIAPEWFKRWSASASYHIEQIHLIADSPQTPPLDGDLYLVSPALVKKITPLMEWQAPSDIIPLELIKPLFIGHSFDPDNRVSLPWKWSPYVFYRRKLNAEQSLPPLTFSGWSLSEDSLWPEDWALLWAMKRHLTQGSANAAVNDTEIASIKTLQEQLKGHVSSESDCWKNFSEGKIKHTMALAAWRFLSTQPEDPSITWAIPSQGTLIQFDHLMIPAKSPYLKDVQEFVSLLLSIEAQKELHSLTGYFPVRTDLPDQVGKSGLHLPEGSWMDNSEFLMLDLNALLIEQVPTPTTTPPSTEP